MLTKEYFRELIPEYQKRFQNLSAQEVLEEAFRLFPVDQIAQSSSFAIESQTITSMIMEIRPDARIFTIDTGRLPQETYNVMSATMNRYGFRYEVLFPDFSDVEKMVSEHGPNLFYDNRDKRLLCCRVRKVEPLKRKLATLSAWICGLRKGQSVTRTGLRKIEWDEVNGLVKINPIADWTLEQVWEYIRKHNVPYNALYDRGYTSIGCEPCTRAVQLGEDVRAGRWWWEKAEHKECGLHARPINYEI